MFPTGESFVLLLAYLSLFALGMAMFIAGVVTLVSDEPFQGTFLIVGALFALVGASLAYRPGSLIYKARRSGNLTAIDVLRYTNPFLVRCPACGEYLRRLDARVGMRHGVARYCCTSCEHWWSPVLSGRGSGP